MEVFAAMLHSVDQNMQRLVTYLRDTAVNSTTQSLYFSR